MEIDCKLEAKHLGPILEDLEWLESYIESRMKVYFDPKGETVVFPTLSVRDDQTTPYSRFISSHKLDFVERVVLLMSIVPLLKPQLFDCFYVQNVAIERLFSEFGGIEEKDHRGFIPTRETVNFVVNGGDIIGRTRLFRVFSDDHFFLREHVLSSRNQEGVSSFWAHRLVIHEDFLHHLISGEPVKPKFSTEFPAKELNTSLTLEDLVVSKLIKEELMHLFTWIKYRDEINYSEVLKRNFRAGYRALFYGPPGTGKSLTAAIVGKLTGLPVYRIDLSRVVSKYIGETEKNLSKLLDIAENKNWILFFDEAESLFSKRTEINDSKDKYANQSTAFLLQRLEVFDGLVILATNLRPNMDKAFVRRFQSIIHFNLPSLEQRIELWKKSLKDIKIAPETDILFLAGKYEISGASINNAIQFAWLNSKRDGRDEIQSLDLEAGLLREISKEGKSVK